MSLSVTVQHSLWFGAFSWFSLVLVWLLWQGSLLQGEVLLGGGMTGLSKMQTYVHRLVLWITFRRLHAVLSKQWVARKGWHRRGIEQEENNMGWAKLLIRDALMGVWIYYPTVATLTVGKFLWDCVSIGSGMTGFSEAVNSALTSSSVPSELDPIRLNEGRAIQAIRSQSIPSSVVVSLDLKLSSWK